MGFPGGSDGKECAYNEGDLGSITESGRSPGGGHDNSLQYSYLENSMDRGASWPPVHGVVKSQTQLSDFHFHLIWLEMGIANELRCGYFIFSQLILPGKESQIIPRQKEYFE